MSKTKTAGGMLGVLCCRFPLEWGVRDPLARDSRWQIQLGLVPVAVRRRYGCQRWQIFKTIHCQQKRMAVLCQNVCTFAFVWESLLLYFMFWEIL